MSTTHDYKYTVQVKSRFDLFASEDFGNEDPDLLLSKIRDQKHKKAPKEGKLGYVTILR